MSRTLLFLLMHGCEYHSLDDVPIDGGSPDQRAVLLAALDGFETAIGPWRVTLREIAFGEVPPGAIGLYRNRRIVLRADLSPEEVEVVAWHELCHALDDVENLSTDKPVLVDLAAGALLAPQIGLADGRKGEREAFAILCEEGPLPSRVFSGACGGEWGDVWEGFSWLVDVGVWQADAILPMAPAPPAEGGTWTLTSAPDGLTMSSFEPDIIQLSAVWPDGSKTDANFHAYDGRPATEPSGGPVNGDIEVAGLPTLAGLEISQGAGYANGPASLVVEYPMFETRDTERRLLLWDGDGYFLPENGCYESGQVAHQDLDGHVWVARLHDAEISWNRADPEW